MPRPLLGSFRCAACGALGHVADRSGEMCSRSALVLQAVEDGASPRDAAECFGVTIGTVYQALYQRRKRGVPTVPNLERVRAFRRTLIARGAEWMAGRWARRRRFRLEVPDWFDWLDGFDETPRIDARGAEHAELPNPDRWQAIGWRALRRP